MVDLIRIPLLKFSVSLIVVVHLALRAIPSMLIEDFRPVGPMNSGKFSPFRILVKLTCVVSVWPRATKGVMVTLVLCSRCPATLPLTYIVELSILELMNGKLVTCNSFRR